MIFGGHVHDFSSLLRSCCCFALFLRACSWNRLSWSLYARKAESNQTLGCSSYVSPLPCSSSPPSLCFPSTGRRRVQETNAWDSARWPRFGASTKLHSDQSAFTRKLCKQPSHAVLKLLCCIYYEKTRLCRGQVSRKRQNRWVRVVFLCRF